MINNSNMHSNLNSLNNTIAYSVLILFRMFQCSFFLIGTTRLNQFFFDSRIVPAITQNPMEFPLPRPPYLPTKRPGDSHSSQNRRLPRTAHLNYTVP